MTKDHNMSPPKFTREVEKINSLLKNQSYATAARECLTLIEGGLREILVNSTDKLEENDQRIVRAKEQELAKGSRGKSFKNFTLGQLICTLRDTKFFEAWEKVSHRKFRHLIDLNELNKLRTELFHAESLTIPQREITQSEAEMLFAFLKTLGELLEPEENLKQGSRQSFKSYPMNDMNTATTITHIKNLSIEAGKSVGWFILTIIIGLTTVWLDVLICFGTGKGCIPLSIVMESLFFKSSLLIACLTIVAALLNDNLFVNCEYSSGREKFLFSLVPIFYFGGGIGTYVVLSLGSGDGNFRIQFQLLFFAFTLVYAAFVKWYGWRYGNYVCSFDVSNNKVN